MTATMTTLSSTEACEAAGITYRQLDYWCRKRVIFPARRAHGSGTRRAWTPESVEALRVLGLVASTFGTASEFGGHGAHLSSEVLAQVYDAAMMGEKSVELPTGVTLSWP